MTSPLLDSREGAEQLMKFAKQGGYVLSEHHRKLAEKWGADTTGVQFTGKIPVSHGMRSALNLWNR